MGFDNKKRRGVCERPRPAETRRTASSVLGRIYECSQHCLFLHHTARAATLAYLRKVISSRFYLDQVYSIVILLIQSIHDESFDVIL